MESFLQRFGGIVLGVLHGFDRIRFRGSIRWLSKSSGVMHFLSKISVLLKDFPEFAEGRTKALRKAVEEAATEQGRSVEYVTSSETSKEELALAIEAREGVRDGLAAVLAAVEPCQTFRVRGNRKTQKLELRSERSKCLYYYHYYRDAQLGWLHTRLQTWFPYTMQICMNGREWLSRQMDAAGLKYLRRDNCFAWIEDVAQAQRFVTDQLRTDWQALLEELAQRSHRLKSTLLPVETPYYWSVDESEWASDVMFGRQKELSRLMPAVVRHGLHVLGSVDIMRFLGHKIPAHGGINGHFAGEVITDFKRRPEGVRIKHQLQKNWMKLYDKQGTVLRIETVINDVKGMKSYRGTETAPEGPKDWRRLRKGVADLHRRVEISQQANERYAASLATVEEKTPLKELSEPVCRAVTWQGRRARALNPLASTDAKLLEAVSRGEFLMNGFRNRDIRTLLFSRAVDKDEQRRQSGAVTRSLRLLRAHGLIQKVPKTHRYVVSAHAKKTIAALLNARAASAEKLLQAA
jgi:hypothetical protein